MKASNKNRNKFWKKIKAFLTYISAFPCFWHSCTNVFSAERSTKRKQVKYGKTAAVFLSKKSNTTKWVCYKDQKKSGNQNAHTHTHSYIETWYTLKFNVSQNESQCLCQTKPSIAIISHSCFFQRFSFLLKQDWNQLTIHITDI